MLAGVSIPMALSIRRFPQHPNGACESANCSTAYCNTSAKETALIYAEKKHEGSEQGYNHIRYIVYNGDVIGTYTMNIDPRGRVYGVSRDYHRIATGDEIAAHNAYQSYLAMNDDGQE